MYRTRDSQPCQKQRLGWEGCKLCNLLVFQEPIFLITIEIHDMYVKRKLTDEPSWPMCILDLSKQPAKGTAQNTERLNVNGAACIMRSNEKDASVVGRIAQRTAHQSQNCLTISLKNIHVCYLFTKCTCGND